jgi:hypothetical protein
VNRLHRPERPLAVRRAPHGVARALLGAAVLLSTLLTALLIAPLMAPLSAHAAHQPQAAGITLEAAIGFDGYFRDLTTTPVRVVVANDGPDRDAQLEILREGGYGEQSENAVYVRPVALPSRSRKVETLYLPGNQNLRNAEVRLTSGGEILARATLKGQVADDDDLIVAVISSRPSTLDVLNSVRLPGSTTRVAALSLDALPPDANGWDALSALIVDDVATDTLSEAQRGALAAWLARGGHLIVAGGPGWQATASGLGPLLPASASGTRAMGVLAALTGINPAPLSAGPYVAAELAPAPGSQIVLAEGALPLLVVGAQGNGTVSYLALSTTTAPLDSWAGNADLWKSILARTLAGARRMPGVQDYSAAADAVRSLPILALPSTLQILAFLGLYVLAIGPVNYAVLRRARRLELAWLTIPGLVVLFTIFAYLTGFSFRGNEPILHRLAVVSGRAGVDTAQVDLLIGVYSPQRRSYDLVVPGRQPLRPLNVLMSGADPSGVSIVTGADTTTARDVRVDIAGMRLFTARTSGPGPGIVAAVRRGSSALRYEGMIRNTGSLTLRNAHLLYGTATAPLGDLAPGAELEVNATLSSSAYGYDLTARLIGPGPMNREQYRRMQLLRAALQASGAYGSLRAPGAELYLVGWAESFPGDAWLDGWTSRSDDLALYVIALPLARAQQTGITLLDETDMDWTVVAQSGGLGDADPRPDTLAMSAGAMVAFDYTPRQPVTARELSAIVVTLHTYDPSAAPPHVGLWNWRTARWTALRDVAWDVPLRLDQGASDHINSSTQAIRLRLTAPAGGSALQPLYITGIQIAVEGQP